MSNGFYPFLLQQTDMFGHLAPAEGTVSVSGGAGATLELLAVAGGRMGSSVTGYTFSTGNAPPPFATADLQFLLSGGVYNSNKDLSLGGSASITGVGDGANNLFGSITEDSAAAAEFRCLYVKNSNSQVNLTNVKVYISQLDDGGAEAELGMLLANEVQQIVLSGDPVGGSFALRYTRVVNGADVSQTTGSIAWVPSLTTMETRIEAALNSLTFLESVSVSASRPSSSAYVYEITFTGADGNRSHEILSVADNEMLGSGVAFSASSLVKGQPINAAAASVGFANQSPSGIVFSKPAADQPVAVGDLFPGDQFPVWLRRTITEEGLELAASPTEINRIDGVRLSMTAGVQWYQVLD